MARPAASTGVLPSRAKTFFGGASPNETLGITLNLVSGVLVRPVVGPLLVPSFSGDGEACLADLSLTYLINSLSRPMIDLFCTRVSIPLTTGYVSLDQLRWRTRRSRWPTLSLSLTSSRSYFSTRLNSASRSCCAAASWVLRRADFRRAAGSSCSLDSFLAGSSFSMASNRESLKSKVRSRR